MPLREDFVRQGDWLFRRRSFFPLLGAPLLVLALSQFSYPWGNHTADLICEALCLAVSFFGLAIRAYTTGCTPKRTSGRNTKKGQIADLLNVDGMYSLVRHPLYVGNFFVGLGPVMFLRAWWLVLVYIVVYWIYYERIMYAEEEFLREKFGDVYIEWAARTPVLLPSFKHWRPPLDRPFSWRVVLKREYQTLFLLILVCTGLELAGDAVVERKLVLAPLWIGTFSVALIFFFVVRWVRKRTRLLDVPGR